MKKTHQIAAEYHNRNIYKYLFIGMFLLLLQVQATGQTFEFPHSLFVDSISLKDVLLTQDCDTFSVSHDAYNSMTNAKEGHSPDFTVKSVTALTNFKVNVQSLEVGKFPKFTYMITYQTVGKRFPADPNPHVSGMDTLSVSYDGDSLKLINDRSFEAAGSYSELLVVVCDVFEITDNNGVLNYQQLTEGIDTNVPPFVHVYGEVYLQKYMDYPSLNMGSISKTDYINSNGTVLLDWAAGFPNDITPAAYEVEWTYVFPYGPQEYDFRNNATRIFTNNTSYSIPVAEKEGTLVYRVRMVRPDLNDLQSRKYGSWSVSADYGSLGSVSANSIAIQRTHHDSLNWDMRMLFVEDGLYKQVMTYYDGLLKPRQVQTRFNSNPSQTIVAQSLYDYEGREVISSLPIPVNGVSKFSYLSNFLYPSGSSEYSKSMYDAIPDPDICPPKEVPVPPLDANAPANQYFSANNPDKSGENAFIPDAEGYPLVRKILAAENNEKVLFEGQAGAGLQLGNDRHTAYLYGAPLQAELNRYFGQDIGKYNYYRKMITTDNHGQDMFSITDDAGRIVASGLIGSPDTTSFALSIRNLPDTGYFHSNLLPVPNIRMGEHWRNNGAYFIETDANYEFKYQIDYTPYKPCPDTNVGLSPKIYYAYEVIDPCGDTVLHDSGNLGETGVRTTPLTHAAYRSKYLDKGNYTWYKHSYIKIEDLRASVDTYLDNGYHTCFLPFDHFLKQEFDSAAFPCQGNYDPCDAMRLNMIKEMYPRAKYGDYQYTDNLSKTFTGAGTNSIFSLDGSTYLYQAACVPDYVDCVDTIYNINDIPPQTLISIFNDSIAAALLPLHPDYCKLQLCPVLNNPYCKLLGSIKKASEASRINRFELEAIAGSDPISVGYLTIDELKRTISDELPIDSIAFMKTICGSESGVIESVCADINATKMPSDITYYPEHIQDEYYRTLIELYTANRDDRISKYLQESASSCAPCSGLMLTESSSVPLFSQENDTTFLVSGMDSLTTNLNMPVNGSFGRYFDTASAIDVDSLNSLKNGDNSKYCTSMVDHIVSTLSGCDVSQTTLDALQDTLGNRFCSHNNSITTLSYDSLTTILGEVGISTNDLCNAGLMDLRRITRKSHDFVQTGLLQYPPAYYEDLSGFMENKGILDFIAGSADTLVLSLALCDDHPFQQRLAGQLGTSPGATCSDTQNVQLVKTILPNSNAIQLAFTDNSIEVNYFLYPTSREVTNALNDSFGAFVISSTSNYEINSIFNLYGFDKVSRSFANRNTAILRFDGTQRGNPKRFSYFLSAFNELVDHNLMEADQEEYLNGIGCSEFIPVAKEAITMAENLNIKFGHPYFEKYLTNVLNYRNSVNFDFNSYNSALISCGVTDSIIIPKIIAHYRIQFNSMNDLEDFVDTLRAYDTAVSISDVKAYNLYGTYLLFNIHEAHERTIHDARQIVETLAPVGTTIEYMPSLPKDTVAQLIVYDFDAPDPMQFKNALGSAFPGATIYPGPMDPPLDVSVEHFIPGMGKVSLHGFSYTIVNNIATAYDYNHYVDSVYSFITANAPMTTIFTHAEPGVSKQYDDWQMEAWRDYVRSLPADNHNANVKGSKADRIKFEVPSFAGSSLSYKNFKNPYYQNNLYINDNTTGTVYSYIVQLLQHLNGVHGTILHTYPHLSPYVVNFGSGNTQTRTYVCGDTSQFWINHFDEHSKMTNIFIQLPDYLPMARERYALVAMSKGAEKDSSTYIKLTLGGYDPGSGITDTFQCIGFTNRNLGETYTIPSAYLTSHSRFETVSGKFENCETRSLLELYPAARIRYNLYRDSMRNVFVSAFRQDVIDSLKEQLTISGSDIKNGITLYYYDVAGNRVMTVPPAGVAERDVTYPHSDSVDRYRSTLYNGGIGIGSISVPEHTKTSRYTYNAQNKTRSSNTPDAGAVEHIYDLAGRLVISQDGRQRAFNPQRCTYFLYDNLSRLVETGEVRKSDLWKQPYFGNDTNTFNSQVKALTRYEVTATMYDTPSYQVAGPFQVLPAQENLKNRISCVKYYELINPNANAIADTNYINALHYSYDVSGNVKTLVHDLRTVADQLLRFKRVDYEYDLYSGKVILVSYNRGYADQFYQRYKYDSDNRIVETETSNNGIFWDRDAHYDYYEHGPLARMELGEQRVQGVDYAYTINGWLKAINGVQNDPYNDMGMDGDVGLVTPKDVFSQRIDYFAGDYRAIGDTNTFRELPATQKELYNGNIAAVATALAPFDNLYKRYHYDPLQRIDRAEYEEFTVINSPTPSYTKTPLLAWASEYKYDFDGNLLELKRMGGDVPPSVSTHLMDSLIYQYTPETNRLKSLADLANTNQYKIDIPYNVVDTLTDYLYDGNGNMTKDVVSGLNEVAWTRAGKVKHIFKTGGEKMFFTYDPLGNRLSKELVQYPASDTMVKYKTTYIRDAAGNILAIYEDKKEFDVTGLDFEVLKGDPWIGTGVGPISAPLGKALADKLYAAYMMDPGTYPLAKQAMTIPEMEGYLNSSALLQGLVSSLDPTQGLTFVKSIPAITTHTLIPPDGTPVTQEKLSSYMQPVLLSEDLESLQADLFMALKNNDEPLYYNTVSTVPVTQNEKDNFPSDPTMLQAFRAMPMGEKLSITNTLAQSLATMHIGTLPPVVGVMETAYSDNNTYGNFVQELPEGAIILDELKQDAVNYIAYRYALADMEEVPLSTVKAEFSNNPVLTDVVTQQGPEPEPEALATILSTNFADVVDAADNNGEGDDLTSAFKSVIVGYATLNDQAVSYNWLRQHILKSQQQHLAEHHIYGSSRLGIQKYLPEEAQYHFSAGQSGSGTTNTLATTRPWYSLYGNDLFKPTVYSNLLDTAHMGTQGMGIGSHVLGNRHYELTNHLGNVQAAILDRATPILDNDTLVTGYRTDMSLAHDHYPFGMLMPGRYVSDTDRKCVTINTTVLVPIIKRVYIWETIGVSYQHGDPGTIPVPDLPVALQAVDEPPYVYHYNDASTHPNGEVITGELVNDRAEYGISLSGEPSGGVTAYFIIHADTNQTEQELGFDVTLPPDCYMRMRVRQYTGAGEEYSDAVPWMNVDMSGAQQLLVPIDKPAVMAGGKTILELEFNSALGGSFPVNPGEPDVYIRNYYTIISHYEPKTQIATICDDKDNYRFGFNGQEKDNEIKGIGNSLDFGARIYASRLGRFLSVDPLAGVVPNYSPYHFAGDNPIEFIDKNGELRIHPNIKKDYPRIYKYLSTNIENDVMRSTKIVSTYKAIFPGVNDANIRSVFKNNSGPQIYTIPNPGQQERAAGKTDYDPDAANSIIEINTKVFAYIEDKLKDGTDMEKKLAMQYLFQLVTHEGAHELKGYNGTNTDGSHKKLSKSEAEKRAPASLKRGPRHTIIIGEEGNLFEYFIWHTKTGSGSISENDKLIEGIDNNNHKNNPEELQQGIDKAEETAEGRDTLPTIPED